MSATTVSTTGFVAVLLPEKSKKYESCVYFVGDVTTGKIPAASWCLACPEHKKTCMGANAPRKNSLKPGGIVKVKIRGMKTKCTLLKFTSVVSKSCLFTLFPNDIMPVTNAKSYAEAIKMIDFSKAAWSESKVSGEKVSDHPLRCYIRPE